MVQNLNDWQEKDKSHKNIEFTSEIGGKEINFLDTKLTIHNNGIKTSVYAKDTNTHNYLLPESCHPNHIFKAISHAVAKRVSRICDNETWEENIIKHISYLRQRNYNIYDYIDAFEKMNQISKMDAL